MNLERLRELTADNEHLLALWFIAREYDLESAPYADLVCEHLLAGEISDDLNQRYLAATKDVLDKVRLKYPDEDVSAIRMCL